MEVGFERILAIDGIFYSRSVKTASSGSSIETGEYIDLLDTMSQTIFAVDRDTGTLTYREDIASAGIGDTYTACPGIYGGHNWQSATYDLHLLFTRAPTVFGYDAERGRPGPGGGGYGADGDLPHAG